MDKETYDLETDYCYYSYNRSNALDEIEYLSKIASSIATKKFKLMAMIMNRNATVDFNDTIEELNAGEAVTASKIKDAVIDAASNRTCLFATGAQLQLKKLR